MKPIWTKPLERYEYEDGELRLGIPSWDKGGSMSERDLSVKYVYKKDGRIPRTAPEVAEAIVPEMILFLIEHGRLSGADKDRLRKALD